MAGISTEFDMLGAADGLPAGFVRLSYLEATGVQYINTGVIGDLTTDVFIRWSPSPPTSPNWNRYVVGSRTNSTTRSIIVYCSADLTSGCDFLNYEVSRAQIQTSAFDVIEVRANKNMREIRNLTTGEYAANDTLITSDFTTPGEMYMFWGNSFSTEQFDRHFRGRIYACAIAKNGVAIRNFIPALDIAQQKPCMFDAVNKIAYYNQGNSDDFNFG